MVTEIRATLLLAALLLMCFSVVHAKDPGDACDLVTSSDYSARITEAVGEVSVRTRDSGLAPGVVGMKIPAGATIETGAQGAAVLALEDGTTMRDSRAGLGSATSLSITGGLRCSDMRPKFDESRWTVEKIAMVLTAGEVELEIAQQVSPSFHLEVKTPNTVAEMRRSSQQRMAAWIQIAGLDSRKLVPLLEHPQLQQHFPLQLRGRNLDSLNREEREGMLVFATNAAISLGLVDLEQTGIFDHPTMQSTLVRMTSGRNYTELDQAERNRIAPGLATMALTMGVLDPEKIEIYDQPDEHTSIMVTAGKFRVYNKHRGWKRNEAVDADQGIRVEVIGREIPVTSRD